MNHVVNITAKEAIRQRDQALQANAEMAEKYNKMQKAFEGKLFKFQVLEKIVAPNIDLNGGVDIWFDATERILEYLNEETVNEQSK